MDGWGSLTMLIKRQQADKFRKAALRAKLKSRKEEYLHVSKSRDEFNFPELSNIEMEKLKDGIRNDFKKERVKEIIYYSLIIITIIVCVYFYGIYIKS